MKAPRRRQCRHDDVRRFDVPDRLAIANRLMDEAGLPRRPGGVRANLVLEVNSFREQWPRQAKYTSALFSAVPGAAWSQAMAAPTPQEPSHAPIG